jgi:predicted alpha/beta-hydrolase family hydrolase
LVLLGHGAGGGIEAPDLALLAKALPPMGFTVVRVEQPYRVAGRRSPAPAGQLDTAWLAVVKALRRRPRLRGLPLVVGGRSAGARVACRTAAAVGADAVVALAFPLHPPGRPDRTRADELLMPRAPVLVVQGERDAFGGPADLPVGPAVVALPGADHSLKQALPAVADAVGGWLASRYPAEAGAVVAT